MGLSLLLLTSHLMNLSAKRLSKQTYSVAMPPAVIVAVELPL